jgi:hypothetical protein
MALSHVAPIENAAFTTEGLLAHCDTFVSPLEHTSELVVDTVVIIEEFVKWLPLRVEVKHWLTTNLRPKFEVKWIL